MAKVRKIPYYTMERSIFRGKVWKENDGLDGAVPINTPQKISYNRCAPGQVFLKSAEPGEEQFMVPQTEAGGQKSTAGVRKNKPFSVESKTSVSDALEADAEDKEKLPEFDLQDIPLAMDNIGWPIAAKIARQWFASPKHIYNDRPNSIQPIDDATVTLKWALKYGSVAEKFNELIEEKIYSEKAIAGARHKILKRVKNKFDESRSAANLSFDTAPWIGDIRQFHIDWQIQNEDLAQYRFDRRAVRPHRPEHERREQQAGQRPAIKAYFSRKDHPGRRLGDSCVDRPDKDGNQRESVLHEGIIVKARRNYPPVCRECQRRCPVSRHRAQTLTTLTLSLCRPVQWIWRVDR